MYRIHYNHILHSMQGINKHKNSKSTCHENPGKHWKTLGNAVNILSSILEREQPRTTHATQNHTCDQEPHMRPRTTHATTVVSISCRLVCVLCFNLLFPTNGSLLFQNRRNILSTTLLIRITAVAMRD